MVEKVDIGVRILFFLNFMLCLIAAFTICFGDSFLRSHRLLSSANYTNSILLSLICWIHEITLEEVNDHTIHYILLFGSIIWHTAALTMKIVPGRHDTPKKVNNDNSGKSSVVNIEISADDAAFPGQNLPFGQQNSKVSVGVTIKVNESDKAPIKDDMKGYRYSYPYVYLVLACVTSHSMLLIDVKEMKGFPLGFIFILYLTFCAISIFIYLVLVFKWFTNCVDKTDGAKEGMLLDKKSRQNDQDKARSEAQAEKMTKNCGQSSSTLDSAMLNAAILNQKAVPMSTF